MNKDYNIQTPAANCDKSNNRELWSQYREHNIQLCKSIKLQHKNKPVTMVRQPMSKDIEFEIEIYLKAENRAKRKSKRQAAAARRNEN